MSGKPEEDNYNHETATMNKSQENTILTPQPTPKRPQRSRKPSKKALYASEVLINPKPAPVPQARAPVPPLKKSNIPLPPMGYVPFVAAIKRTDDSGKIVQYSTAPDPKVPLFPCKVEGCLYKAMSANTLRLHMANIHGVNVRWFHCDHEGCKYKAKQKIHVQKHQERFHGREIKWLYCDQEGCDFKAKDNRGVRQHRADVHNIDVIWHYCDIPGCTFRAKQIGNLKKHRAAVSAHQPQALAQQTWFYCGMKGCDFRAKSNNLVTQHKDEVHKITQKWFHCESKLPNGQMCTFKTKQRGNLKRHYTSVHNVGVTWFPCDVPGCTFRARQQIDVKRHRQIVHNLDNAWYKCNFDGCGYQAKDKKAIDQHKSSIHNVDVTWYKCGVKGCTFKAKQPRNITNHKMAAHNIGVVWKHCTHGGCEFKARYAHEFKAHIKEHLRKELEDGRLGLESALKGGLCGICNTALEEDQRCPKCNVSLTEKIAQLAQKEKDEKAAERKALNGGRKRTAGGWQVEHELFNGTILDEDLLDNEGDENDWKEDDPNVEREAVESFDIWSAFGPGSGFNVGDTAASSSAYCQEVVNLDEDAIIEIGGGKEAEEGGKNMGGIMNGDGEMKGKGEEMVVDHLVK